MWREEEQNFIFKDKFWGRTLTSENIFQDGIVPFFGGNGGIQACTQFLGILSDLLQTLSSLPHPLSLYSSSLVLLYQKMDHDQIKVVGKLIDFAHVEELGEDGQEEEEDPMEGVCLGIRNLIQAFEDIVDQGDENHPINFRDPILNLKLHSP